MAFSPIATPSRIASSAASNNATVAKAGEGYLHTVIGYNSNAALRYLKFYNKATVPAPATDIPFMVIPLPPTTAFGINVMGQYFPAGISYALVTGIAENDNTGVGAAEILGLNVCFS